MRHANVKVTISDVMFPVRAACGLLKRMGFVTKLTFHSVVKWTEYYLLHRHFADGKDAILLLLMSYWPLAHSVTGPYNLQTWPKTCSFDLVTSPCCLHDCRFLRPGVALYFTGMWYCNYAALEINDQYCLSFE